MASDTALSSVWKLRSVNESITVYLMIRFVCCIGVTVYDKKIGCVYRRLSSDGSQFKVSVSIRVCTYLILRFFSINYVGSED